MFSMKNKSWLGFEPTSFVATLTAHHIIHLSLGGIGWVSLESNRITGLVLLFVLVSEQTTKNQTPAACYKVVGLSPGMANFLFECCIFNLFFSSKFQMIKVVQKPKTKELDLHILNL